MTTLRGIAAASLWLLMGCYALAASPDPIDEADRLLRQGDLSAAEARIDVLLQQTPKDARARFLKGVVLAERKRTSDAIAVFAAITEDYPELPEPYNNLAVLYAAEGRFDRARESLEAALRARPDFATAHENLGDVYIRMAAQSYEQATKLDRTNASARTKLRMATELLAERTALPTAPTRR